MKKQLPDPTIPPPGVVAFFFFGWIISLWRKLFGHTEPKAPLSELFSYRVKGNGEYDYLKAPPSEFDLASLTLRKKCEHLFRYTGLAYYRADPDDPYSRWVYEERHECKHCKEVKFTNKFDVSADYTQPLPNSKPKEK